MFQCLEETNDTSMISSVGKYFHNQEIDLSNQTLLPSYLSTLGFFLIKSGGKQWKRLDLSKCNIGDTGCSILSKWFLEKSIWFLVNIECVDISYNQFGLQSLINFFRIFKFWCTSEIIITDDTISDSTASSELYKVIENAFVQSRSTFSDRNNKTVKVIVIGSFLFGYKLNLEELSKILFSPSHDIKSVYLLNANWDTNFLETEVLKSKVLLSKLKCIHFLGTVSSGKFMKAVYITSQEKKFEINSLFVHDSTLSEQDIFEIGRLIIDRYIVTSGITLIISENTVQGTINTFSLSGELSNLEILNLITAMRCFCSSSSTAPWREDLQFHGNSSEAVIQSFVDFLYKITSSYFLKICLVEENTLVAHNVGYRTISEIGMPLKDVYLSNCFLNITEYKHK